MKPSNLRVQTLPPSPRQQSSSSTVVPRIQSSRLYNERRPLDSTEASEADGREGEVEREDGDGAETGDGAEANSGKASSSFETSIQASLDWSLQHEIQIKALEAKLANDLSNSRAIHNLIVEALANIEGNTQRVDRALTRHIPHIHKELQNILSRLLELEARFPIIRNQVNAVRRAYDRGRVKAKELQHDLEWTHAPLSSRLHRTLFTRRAPISTMEATLTRLVFVGVMFLCAWQVGGAIEGAYRAYRHRTIWGDKLIS